MHVLLVKTIMKCYKMAHDIICSEAGDDAFSVLFRVTIFFYLEKIVDIHLEFFYSDVL